MNDVVKLRLEALKQAKAEKLKAPVEFTCDGCILAPDCDYAFDLYNQHGDCLAEK